MKCPVCRAWTEVLESRPWKEKVTRRRECANGHRFTTYELVVKETISNGPASGGENLTKKGKVWILKMVNANGQKEQK